MPRLLNKVLDRRVRGIVNRVSARTGSSTATDYSTLWNAVAGDWMVSNLAPMARDKFQHTGNEYLLYALTRLFRDAQVPLVPHIQSHEDAVEAYKMPGGRLILTTHSAYAPCAKLALQAGRKVALMSNYAHTMDRALRQSGISIEQVEVFAPDKLCFPSVQKYLRDAYVVCCTIDFKDDAATFESFSDSFFQFSERTGTPVFFGTSVINSAGAIEFICKGPYEGSSSHLADGFQSFNSQYRPHVRMRMKSFRARAVREEG